MPERVSPFFTVWRTVGFGLGFAFVTAALRFLLPELDEVVPRLELLVRLAEEPEPRS
jgi:hypothetical protein